MKPAHGEYEDIDTLLEQCRMMGASVDAYRGGIVLRTPLRTTIFYGAPEVDWDLVDEIYSICRRDSVAMAEARAGCSVRRGKRRSDSPQRRGERRERADWQNEEDD